MNEFLKQFFRTNGNNMMRVARKAQALKRVVRRMKASKVAPQGSILQQKLDLIEQRG